MGWMTRKATRTLRLAALLAGLALLLTACPGDNDVDVVDDTDDVDDTDAVDDTDDVDDTDAVEDTDDVDEMEADDDAAAAPDAQFLTLGTGSTGGTYFPLGGAIAGVWTGELDGVQVSTQATGASVENLRLLAAGELDIAMAVNGVAADAYEGSGEFEGEEIDITALGNVYAEVMQVVARADAGITTIDDMAGARVAIGPPGSGTEVLARQLLEYHDIDPDNDIESFSDTFGDAADGLRDGQIDAAFAILALPAASIEEVATTTDLVLVSIEGDALDAALAADETLSVLEVEPDTYPGQGEAATFVTNWATMYGVPGLDEDTVYELVRVMYEENEQIAAAHAVGEQIQLDIALDGLGGIPLHPGAQRYFDEQGIAP